MQKTLRAAAQYQGRRVPVLNREHLYRLLKRQHGKCALSGIKLALPPVSKTEFPRGTSIITWRNKLERVNPDAYFRSLDIVEACESEDWAPGNVMLVCHMFYDAYRNTRGVAGFKMLLSAVAEFRVTVVQPELLLTDDPVVIT